MMDTEVIANQPVVIDNVSSLRLKINQNIYGVIITGTAIIFQK